MISFFPDLNVWLALSDIGHRHHAESWNWFGRLPPGARLIFWRYTQIGLLRLLSNSAVMGEYTVTLERAWSIYDEWLADPRVELYPEPRGMDAGFREATERFAGRAASKWVGDCYILAYAKQSQAVLVTFDRALYEFAGKQGHDVVRPG